MAEKLTTVRRFDIGSVMLMAGCIGGIVGLALGIIIGLLTIAWGAMIPLVGGAVMMAGVFYMVLLPIGGFIVGLLEGLVFTALYNWLVPRIGPVKVVLE